MEQTDSRDRPVEITKQMIAAGLAAYAGLAWHDSASAGSPREIVEAILQAGILACKSCGHAPTHQ